MRRVPLHATLAVAIALAALPIAAAPTATAVGLGVLAALPTGVTPVSGSLTFYGRGYGHGAGLSQYGARGRALAGQSAATIIAHYYRDTTLGKVDPARPIRVLLLSGWAASSTAPLVIYGRGGAWAVDGVAGWIPANAKLSLTPSVAKTATGTSVAWRMRIYAPDGRLLYDAPRSGGFRVGPVSASTRLEVAAKPANKNRYRGLLTVLPRTDAAAVSVINQLALDYYLRGVVPAEMPASWPVQALRAQAIVARSYAVRAIRGTGSSFDVYDDTRSQVYQGSLGEHAATTDAIAATSGTVVKYGTAVANTVFHSAAGGYTEHNENVFVSSAGEKIAAPAPYLRGAPDRAADGSRYDAAAPYYKWVSGTWTVSSLSTWLGRDPRTSVGTLVGLDLRNRGVSGRLISVTIYGTTGTKKVSGNVFRSVINTNRTAGSAPIRSNLFDLKPIP